VLDEPLEGKIGDPQVGADDDTRDQHDRGALDQLLLTGPLDLLQLRRGLAYEVPEAGAGKPALARDGRGLGVGHTHRRLALHDPGVAAVLLPLLLGAAGASLGSGLLGHC